MTLPPDVDRILLGPGPSLSLMRAMASLEGALAKQRRRVHA